MYLTFVQTIFQNSVPTSQGARFISNTETNLSVLFRESTTVYSKNQIVTWLSVTRDKVWIGNWIY
jgi:hypothetical protein